MFALFVSLVVASAEAPKPKPGLPNVRAVRIASVIAGALARQGLGQGQLPGTPVTLPDPEPGTITWASGTRSGTGRLWRTGQNEWTCQPDPNMTDYFLVHYGTIVYSGGIPVQATVQLNLETPGGTLWSPNGFTLASSSSSPVELVYNATRAVKGWDTDLVVTITFP